MYKMTYKHICFYFPSPILPHVLSITCLLFFAKSLCVGKAAHRYKVVESSIGA